MVAEENMHAIPAQFMFFPDGRAFIEVGRARHQKQTADAAQARITAEITENLYNATVALQAALVNTPLPDQLAEQVGGGEKRPSHLSFPGRVEVFTGTLV